MRPPQHLINHKATKIFRIHAAVPELSTKIHKITNICVELEISFFEVI